MGRVHRAMARRRWGAHQLLHAEMQQPRAHPHHIHQGIHGPHLMEMHLLGAVAMHRPLRLRQLAKHRQHALLQRRLQGGRRDLLAQLPPEAMGGRGLQQLHLQVLAPQATAAALLQPQPKRPRQPQGRQGLLHRRRGQPQIKQGRQQHVAGQAGGAIHQGQWGAQRGGCAHRAPCNNAAARSSSRPRCCRSHCSTSRRARRCSCWAVATAWPDRPQRRPSRARSSAPPREPP